jgi:hypothetical protein
MTAVAMSEPLVDSVDAIGAGEFARQVRALGLSSVEVDGEWVLFDLEIPAGKHAGEMRRIAAQVPADFPDTPPSGPHVTPATTHPAGAVHASPRGEGWVYWSRPIPGWAADRSARAWVRHVRSLFGQVTHG